VTNDEIELQILQSYIDQHKTAEIADPERNNKCARELDMRAVLSNITGQSGAELDYEAGIWHGRLTQEQAYQTPRGPLLACSDSRINNTQHRYHARAYINGGQAPAWERIQALETGRRAQARSERNHSQESGGTTKPIGKNEMKKDKIGGGLKAPSQIMNIAESTSFKPAAFMSYTHLDDERDGRRLTEFRKHLSSEVRAQTGEAFVIFQDRTHIEWGQNWEERIDGAINQVTFLIPIISPGYFKSQQCRDELEKFLKRERELGRNDLILPLYHIDTPLMNDNEKRASDSSAQAIAAHQYADWRDLRFDSFDSAAVCKRLADLAIQIRNALERTVVTRDLRSEQSQETGPDSDEIRSGRKGLVEANEAVKGMLTVITKLIPSVNKSGKKVNDEMERFNRATNTPQQRRSATLIASHLRNGCKEFEQILPNLGETIDTLIEVPSGYAVWYDPNVKEDREQLTSFRGLIDGLLGSITPAIETLQLRRNNAGKLGVISAEVDSAAKRMAHALQDFISLFERFENYCQNAIGDIDGRLSGEDSTDR
jgi:TIR domain-containing protein